jgi:type IV pilus assembly protein PilA
MKRGEEMPRMRKGEGFTLIELMIVVTIVGVLAAIAIPAYNDYVKRSRMSEVVYIFDAIAQGATEYHGSLGFFPAASYGADNLASFSDTYATVTLVDDSADLSTRDVAMKISAVFKPTLDLTEDPADTSNGTLIMLVTFDPAKGYAKRWDYTNSSIDPVYYPKGGS